MQENMKKIIHLSDLHIGYGACRRNFDILINKIIAAEKRASRCVVVVTGDLVQNATQSAQRRHAKRGIDRLREAGFTPLVVPGNHDYGTGSHGYKRYVDIFKQTFFGTTTVQYPKLDVIGNVAFIGVDSTAEELHWYDHLFAQGEIGKRQLRRLATLLDSEKVRRCAKRVVYMHHHPFDPRLLHELRDSKALRKVIRGRIDALLFGHNHAGRTWHGKWDIPRCYDGGSSTRKQSLPGPAWVIDLSKDPASDYAANYI